MTAPNIKLMAMSGGGGYLPVGVKVWGGADNYLTTELSRGRDNRAICFSLYVCVTGIFEGGRLVLN